MLKNLRNRLKNQKGLTLIELLAVIVILGIIAAIAVPSIGGLIDKTRDDALKADAVQVLNAAKLYSATNNISTSITLDDNDGELDQYLDNIPDNYTITIKVGTNKKYQYTDIEVKKDGKTKYFATEQAALDGNNTTKE
ncbi:type II secretion system protein [Bacillus sp. NTK034]|uniref:type II secretion system protein n=1 Tax=Bacillus sp. NTK034 TaxID=2802176 RepID=UPI001A8F04F4|nr:prepilin-type N-terminal cleavage/methylation domain-containing protein [Bacillus sp. NTK034]MBN8200721.1 prepilin-type N-terminal cleavage/methylation domain-containing protein [Bacillus sp. NTK034]